jgi:two-component system chemotaxis response regulator CheB
MIAPQASPRHTGVVRVLIVDDSAVVRGLTKAWLEGAPDVEIVGVATNGEEAVKQAGALRPDIVILDIEMPKLDGISALPQILVEAPGAKVIMASTLTKRNAEITLKALSLGASDYIPKPDSGSLASAIDYRRELVEKVRVLGGARQRPTAGQAAARALKPQGGPPKFSNVAPKILAIGASTGGPQALRDLIVGLGAFKAPILITQHMPATFTGILASHLDSISPLSAVEAKDGMPVRAGQIYVAPGDFHMTVKRKSGAAVIGLDQHPPENFCRPAVDPLFRSVAEVYGPETLAVVLTGMGHDGAAGAQAVLAAGGSVIAQDEASSVVWGMPGAVVAAGAACAVEPLGKMAPAILDVFAGKRR